MHQTKEKYVIGLADIRPSIDADALEKFRRKKMPA
jgi:hypothetical protein